MLRTRNRVLATQKRRSRLSDKFRYRAKPRIESLEQRRLLTAQPIEVTNNADDGDGSLRAAVELANATPGPDTIVFANDVRGTIELDPDNGALLVTDDLTIRGPGVNRLSVSGGDATRVFGVLPEALIDTPFQTPSLAQLESSPELSIKQLTIADGLATDALGFDPTNPATAVFAFGGGIYNMGGEVSLDRVAMVGNAAENVVTAGGAVANEFGGSLDVTRSSFSENVSAGFLIGVGGAITSDLGPTTDGVTTGQPEVSIDRSRFTDNRAQAALGYIDGVEFSGAGVGGAVLNVTGVMEISRSHFESNVAQGGTGAAGDTSAGPAFGGAVASGDASPFGFGESELSIRRSTFVGNAAIGGDSGADGIDGGEARGGAVSINSGSEGRFLQNVFTDNQSLGGDGGMDANGGIANGGGVATAGDADLQLIRNRFSNNRAAGGSGAGTGFSAAGRGGGLGIDQIELAGFFPGPASVEIIGDRYDGNVAVGAGGGIFNDGTLAIENGRLSNNRAIGESTSLIDFFPGYVFQAGALGGGLSNIGSVTLTDTSLVANKAIGADGGVGPLFTSTGTATYPGLAVGGGLHNLNIATATDSHFEANESLGGNRNQGSFAGVANGGGVYNDGAFTAIDSSFIGNVAAAVTAMLVISSSVPVSVPASQAEV
ncbi:MAG: hypothetical protein AAGJ83_01690 [Planctomycetota bacterium]